MMLMQSKLMIILTRTNSDIDMEPLEAWPSALVGRYSRPQGAGATILPTPYQYFTSSELFPVIPVQKIDIIS